MRKRFFDLLIELMVNDPDIFMLTGNLGYGGADRVMKAFPDQAYDCGASEQTMMGMAVGLAESGKKVLVYSITPFLLWRAAETIRNYIDHEKTPIVLCGAGRGEDYSAHGDGFTHSASDDMMFLASFPRIKTYRPESNDEVEKCVREALANSPAYINLSRF